MEEYIQTTSLYVQMQLDEERLGQRILKFHRLHRSEEELQGIADLAIPRRLLEILDENARCDVKTESHERIHLFMLAAMSTVGGRSSPYSGNVVMTSLAHYIFNGAGSSKTSILALFNDAGW